MESGQTIAGKYRLNRLIGAGGMASVWSATNVFTERQFAVKFMLPTVARTPEAAKRFLLEAKVSARINHPNIIEVIDVGQAEDGSLFLVMELLTGTSLESGLRRKTPTMTLHELMVVMLDVARALAAAHKSGVVHRDLKPTNVFLHQDREGVAVPKVLDFGVSKVLEDEGLHGLTMAGTVLGSPLYMSPEQACGSSSIDGRTDIFAFGAMIFEALCGVRCFDAQNFNALIVAIATTQPKSIDDVASDVPESLRSLVRDCLVTDRTKRLASFDLAAERISAMLPELKVLDKRIPTPKVPSPPSMPDASFAGGSTRKSDRPNFPTSGAISLQATPAAMSHNSGNAFSSPWATPQSASPHGSDKRMWLMAGGGFVATALIMGLVFTAIGPQPSAARSVQASTTQVVQEVPARAAASAPTASAEAVVDVPVINVDSLPQASAKADPTSPKSAGRLLVVASSGWCNVSVDGVPRGATPLPPLELTQGAHNLECKPPSGKTRVARVNVQDGATARYKFALDN